MQTFGAKWIVDASIARQWGGWTPSPGGVNNVFDVYPDKNLASTVASVAAGTNGSDNAGIFPLFIHFALRLHRARLLRQAWLQVLGLGISAVAAKWYRFAARVHPQLFQLTGSLVHFNAHHAQQRRAFSGRGTPARNTNKLLNGTSIDNGRSISPRWK